LLVRRFRVAIEMAGDFQFAKGAPLHDHKFTTTEFWMNQRRWTMADNDNGSGLGWFLAGLGVGALVGVLYAPKSGRETREELAMNAQEARERAAAYAQQGIDRANTYVEQGKQVAGDYVDRGKEYYEKGRSQWSEYVEKGKSLVHEQQEKVAAAVDAGKSAYTSKTSGSGS